MAAETYYLPDLGKVIADRGYTIRYVAGRLAMHDSSVGNWATGERPVPTARVLMLADILELLPDELVKRGGGNLAEYELETAPVVERPAPAPRRIYHGFDGMPMVAPR